MSVKIYILVDNSVSLPIDLLAEYGFSAYVEDEDTGIKILFDTGETGIALEHNMKKLNIDPHDIDYVVLSHRHYDHTGGLKKFLQMRDNEKITVIAHKDLFNDSYMRLKNLPKHANLNKISGTLSDIGLTFRREELESMGAKFLLIKEPIFITNKLAISGEIPRNWGPSHNWGMMRNEDGKLVEDLILDDIALYYKTSQGLLALTGCGHAGVENIVEYGLKVMEENEFFGIIGGLHLLSAPPQRINDVVEYLAKKNPKAVMANHCSGPLIQGLLSQKLSNAYKIPNLGAIIEA